MRYNYELDLSCFGNGADAVLFCFDNVARFLVKSRCGKIAEVCLAAVFDALLRSLVVVLVQSSSAMAIL